jgi:hypothetical protein
MMGKVMPGLCLKNASLPGETGENPLIFPLNDHRETLAGILVEIDRDA